ncbi:desiccation-related protein PCC13-62-like, partial [Cynara cardunculus var. scolymus]
EIKSRIRGFRRPLLNLSAHSFATVINQAFGRPLYPLFDPYINDINYMLSSYIIPYVGLTGYVGATPKLKNPLSRKLVAGLLAVESGQDAVFRSLLYERAMVRVIPYGITVAEFTDRISALRNKLGRGGIKDEGLVVATNNIKNRGKMTGNVLVGDMNSLAYGRTPKEILRIVYGSGKEQVPGGFYPHGANGTIARKYLKRKKD